MRVRACMTMSTPPPPPTPAIACLSYFPTVYEKCNQHRTPDMRKYCLLPGKPPYDCVSWLLGKETSKEHHQTRGMYTVVSSSRQVFGKRLLTSLTEAFGRMIFGAGFVHGDPHPGNIFIMDGGKVALIDCGQVRGVSGVFEGGGGCTRQETCTRFHAWP